MNFSVPTGIETFERHRPWANWIMILATIAAFFWSGMAVPESPPAEDLILSGWSFTGIFGHLFLHASVEHLVGNLLFLWIFGNTVCQTFGSLLYLLLYFGTGLCAAIAHLLFDGHPAIGASGAISGLCGLTCAFFPLNRLSHSGTGEPWTESRVWMVCALSAAWDFIGIVRMGTGIGHWAHLGGLFSGLGIGLLMLHRGWIELSSYDHKSLYEILTGRDLPRFDCTVEPSLE